KLFDLERIENPMLMFDLDQPQIRSDQEEKLRQLIGEIEHLHQLAGQKKVTLEITGHTDSSGTEARNTNLSQGRAESVASALKANLPPWPSLIVRPVGTKDKLRQEVTEDDKATNRSVTLRVIVDDNN